MPRSLIDRPPSWLVSLCCLLALLSAGSPAVFLSLSATLVASAAPLGSDRPSTEEEDEEEVVVKVSSSNPARLGRSSRPTRGSVVAVCWLAHLPHPHVSASGFPTPPRSPFESGARLPLRC
jgi:hypothetical protein